MKRLVNIIFSFKRTKIKEYCSSCHLCQTKKHLSNSWLIHLGAWLVSMFQVSWKRQQTVINMWLLKWIILRNSSSYGYTHRCDAWSSEWKVMLNLDKKSKFWFSCFKLSTVIAKPSKAIKRSFKNNEKIATFINENEKWVI